MKFSNVAVIGKGSIRAMLSYSTRRWSCDDKKLEALLNAALPKHGMSPSDPNPALTIAKDMVQQFGMLVLQEPQPLPEEIVRYTN